MLHVSPPVEKAPSSCARLETGFPYSYLQLSYKEKAGFRPAEEGRHKEKHKENFTIQTNHRPTPTKAMPKCALRHAKGAHLDIAEVRTSAISPQEHIRRQVRRLAQRFGLRLNKSLQDIERQHRFPTGLYIPESTPELGTGDSFGQRRGAAYHSLQCTGLRQSGRREESLSDRPTFPSV